MVSRLWLFLIVWYQGHGSSILCCQWGALGDSQLNELPEQLVAVSLLGEDHGEAVCSSFTSFFGDWKKISSSMAPP